MKAKWIIACILAGLMIHTPMKAQELVKGLDQSQSFTASSDAIFTFQAYGKTFRAISLWYGSSVVVAVEEAGLGRAIVYEAGKPRGAESSSPRIGFTGDSESKTNRYQIGTHDFTNNGQAELVIAVSDGSDGLGVYVFAFGGTSWSPVGEMVTEHKGIGGCRIFRQALTMKGRDNVLYSWTCHGSTFDFLSSDHSDNPQLLY